MSEFAQFLITTSLLFGIIFAWVVFLFLGGPDKVIVWWKVMMSWFKKKSDDLSERLDADHLEDLERADIRWRMANDAEWREIFGNDYWPNGYPKPADTEEPIEGMETFGYEEGNVFTPTKDDHLYLPGGHIVRRTAVDLPLAPGRRSPRTASYMELGYSEVDACRLAHKDRDDALETWCRCGRPRGHSRVRDACFPKGY